MSRWTRTVVVAALPVVVGAGLAGCNRTEPTYCERVAVVFEGGDDPHAQVEAITELADTTTGQESADWQTLLRYAEHTSGPVSGKGSGAGSGSGSGAGAGAPGAGSVDVAVARLEKRIKTACDLGNQGS